MKVSAQVKTNSKVESVEVLGNGEFLIRVRTPPIDGRANEQVRELLAKHLNVPKSTVTLVRGHKSKKKVFEIP